jgi:hypothetical protein
MSVWDGACHCGRVRFRVTGAMDRVVECNCSICRRKGYLHWIVPQAAFALLAGGESLTTYRFNTGVAQHHFCSVCGVAGFYVPRSHPDMIDVNVRCLDGVDMTSLRLERFDGENWESQIADLHRIVPAGGGDA